MLESLPKIYLASISPRRRQLLESLGLLHTALSPEVDEETATGANVGEVTLRNARAKAQSVLEKLNQPNAIVVAADTLVVTGNEVIGKPANEEEVCISLRKLSKKTHVVVTGLALGSQTRGWRTSITESRVQFKDLKEEEIIEYAQTKEPYDKAGAYAIQGLGSLFIENIDGSYTNVMGFPLETFLKELSALSGIPAYRWFLH